MKKIFAALAVLGIVLGTTTLITPAHAYYSFEGNQNKANNQGNNQGG
jgi:ABC-type lipoprotein release transport system permease subunit